MIILQVNFSVINAHLSFIFSQTAKLPPDRRKKAKQGFFGVAKSENL